MTKRDVIRDGKEIGYWRHFHQYEMPNGEMYLILSDSVFGPYATRDACIEAISNYYGHGSTQSLSVPKEEGP